MFNSVKYLVTSISVTCGE